MGWGRKVLWRTLRHPGRERRVKGKASHGGHGGHGGRWVGGGRFFGGHCGIRARTMRHREKHSGWVAGKQRRRGCSKCAAFPLALAWSNKDSFVFLETISPVACVSRPEATLSTKEFSALDPSPLRDLRGLRAMLFLTWRRIRTLHAPLRVFLARKPRCPPNYADGRPGVRQRAGISLPVYAS
jgi:hypothetical protein